jgi:hypothetical protein
MNYMIFQRKNNKLIHNKKIYCTIFIMKQMSPLVPRDSTLAPNKDSILLFPISVFTFSFYISESQK